MKRLSPILMLLVLLSCAMFFSRAGNAELPQLLFQPWDVKPPEPLKTAPVYIQKDTWHESLRASLEATFAPSLEKDLETGPSEFRPEIVQLTAGAQPVQLTFRVDGLKRLVFATLGRWLEHGSAYFLSPRLFDAQGNSIELKLDGTMVEGKVDTQKGASFIHGHVQKRHTIIPKSSRIIGDVP